MATFTPSCTDIDWLWGSLKPWQILHSTLAERERNGSALDVWELVNETLGAANLYPANSIAREDQQVQAADAEKETTSNWEWAQGMRLLGDDGEFWKPGGVMESRVREWLSRRLQYDADGDDEVEQEQIAAYNQAAAAAAAVTSPLIPSAHNHHHPHEEYNYTCDSELAIAALHRSTTSPNRLQRQYLINAANRADHGHAYTIGGPSADDYQSSYSSDTEEECMESQGGDLIVINQAASARSAAAEDPDLDYRDNYALISSNYEDELDHHYNAISSSRMGECRLVMSRYCSGAAAADREYHNRDHQFGGASRLAAASQPHLEEEIVEELEVCAVCLEKLQLKCGGDEEEDEDAAVQALACRHLFHRACIAPWLQRQPHARCPCCRAPILAPPQQLHLAAPLHVAASRSPSNCSGNHHYSQGAADPPHDIMGLLADMEAALEHLGLRS
ncbi:hypothetical protein L7F22_043099 [Adiantum nelumboides]|nr:hypothetical protein [Adiantum nelumboides]